MFNKLNIYKWLSEFPYAFAGYPDSTDCLDKENREQFKNNSWLVLLCVALNRNVQVIPFSREIDYRYFMSA